MFFNKICVAALTVFVMVSASAKGPVLTPPPSVTEEKPAKFCLIPIKDEDSKLYYINPSYISYIREFRGKTIVGWVGSYVTMNEPVVDVYMYITNVVRNCK